MKNSTRSRDFGWLSHSQLEPGPTNAITDVPGVQVGQVTLIHGDPGPLQVGQGPIRTGVTAILPKTGDLFTQKLTAGVFVQNGYGKTLGLFQIRETGALETPILLTSTLSVWQAADALVDWCAEKYRSFRLDKGASINPVIGECNDGYLNDLRGRHVHQQHVFEALENAGPSRISEGNFGAGTGLRSFGFKSGVGTASRLVPNVSGSPFVVGTLVQANFGKRKQLLIQGRPIGTYLKNWPAGTAANSHDVPEQGSCVIVIGTDAPLSARQLNRLAQRAPLGLARTGGVSGHGSGEVVIAFSNTNLKKQDLKQPVEAVSRITAEGLIFDHFAQAVVESVEEAILNSLVCAETMIGRDHHICHQIPVEFVLENFF
jgi:D-aminopeptidase